jgi:hypothetical protein
VTPLSSAHNGELCTVADAARNAQPDIADQAAATTGSP